MLKYMLFIVSLLIIGSAYADDGYRLWLRYEKVKDVSLLQRYKQKIKSVSIAGSSPTITVIKEELKTGLSGLLGSIVINSPSNNSGLQVSKYSTLTDDQKIKDFSSDTLGDEGFAIYIARGGGLIVTANNDIGLLYGSFHFLRLLQTNTTIDQIKIISTPRIQRRVLNHWDNLNRHVERGYAGISIWNWHTLPGYIDQRYVDYARANASLGINGTVLTNVNANALVLTKDYLIKVAALADAFRPYGIKVYLTARFSAPIEIGGLKTADPINEEVKLWWKNKADEIYKVIPDFGGFLVKANSEGQPGPQNYGRTHVDGANILADAVAAHNGIVMWRAFVYSNETPDDRFKQAYNEFKPFDGKFRKNVLIQVKNGPIDFQPREPFHPLFGAMPSTPLMMEFQITQEYLGQSTNLVYEATMFKEVLESDTYQIGKHSTVARVIDGSLHNYEHTGIAGVANIGNDRNWTGHVFGQANWYAYGRLAWDHKLSAVAIADEWLKQTFTPNPSAISTIKPLMMRSHEIMVNYMTPLGLHHIMGTGHHYGPAPWVDNVGRADWNPVYYHKADSIGLGFDRTITGSNALAQYATEVQKLYGDKSTCPEPFLLWFHHVPWTRTMRSGNNLWQELCFKYNEGVDSVRWMSKQWEKFGSYVDEERFQHVRMLLGIQEKEAVWWRDACLLYFQQFSKQAIPLKYEKPAESLEFYKNLKFPFAPGNG